MTIQVKAVEQKFPLVLQFSYAVQSAVLTFASCAVSCQEEMFFEHTKQL